MFRIASICDKSNVQKLDTMNKIEREHGSLYGEFYYYGIEVGRPFYFSYRDDNKKMLRSSTVEDYRYVESDNLYIITTRNSIYYIVKE